MEGRTNLHSRGVLVLKIVSFEVSGSLGYGKLVDFFGGGPPKIDTVFNRSNETS